jgi:deazaflavin-dependent oxidoreductase (nitroreductase family)
MNYLDLADRIWPALNRVAGAHMFLYRRTGGRLGHTVPGLGPILLLDHVGAKSGTKRTAPLIYVEDGENVVLVGSKGGFPTNPAWFYNLKANPDTAVQIKGERRRVRARVARPEERDRLWTKAVETYSGYKTYQARAGREIPLVVLEPR